MWASTSADTSSATAPLTQTLTPPGTTNPDLPSDLPVVIQLLPLNMSDSSSKLANGVKHPTNDADSTAPVIKDHPDWNKGDF